MNSGVVASQWIRRQPCNKSRAGLSKRNTLSFLDLLRQCNGSNTATATQFSDCTSPGTDTPSPLQRRVRGAMIRELQASPIHDPAQFLSCSHTRTTSKKAPSQFLQDLQNEFGGADRGKQAPLTLPQTAQQTAERFQSGALPELLFLRSRSATPKSRHRSLRRRRQCILWN